MEKNTCIKHRERALPITVATRVTLYFSTGGTPDPNNPPRNLSIWWEGREIHLRHLSWKKSQYLVDHSQLASGLGSPQFTSHEWPFGRDQTDPEGTYQPWWLSTYKSSDDPPSKACLFPTKVVGGWWFQTSAFTTFQTLFFDRYFWWKFPFNFKSLVYFCWLKDGSMVTSFKIPTLFPPYTPQCKSVEKEHRFIHIIMLDKKGNPNSIKPSFHDCILGWGGVDLKQVIISFPLHLLPFSKHVSPF